MTEEEITEAAARLKKGEVIIYPTDTVFGIGAVVSNRAACERLYQIKGRPHSQPTHLLVSSPKMASKYGYTNNKRVERLMEAFWPGPLTIVVPAHKSHVQVSFLMSPGKMIGLRMPDQPELLELIDQVGEAILGPSANKAGKEPPVTSQEIDKEVLSLVDYVIGKTSGGASPSTIVEVDRYNHRLLREGPITEKQIVRVLNKKEKNLRKNFIG